MSRISKGPINTFRENVEVARGFVKLYYYITDLLTTGGKESIGQLIEFGDRIIESYRLGSMKQTLSEQIQSQIEAEWNSIGKMESPF